MKHNLIRNSFLSLLALAFAHQAGAEDSLVATVKSARGNCTIQRGENVVPIQEGTHILLNDSLRTPADGQLGIILQDGTRLSLGPNTELRVDRFVYEPADSRYGLILRLARGAMAYVSGKIAQFSPGSVSVETPVGILGLRGTEFAVSLAGQ